MTSTSLPKAQGFAVLMGGEISVHTVAPTERGAKVNGLVALFGMAVMDRHTDDEIGVAWDEIERRVPGVRVVSVEIVAR